MHQLTLITIEWIYARALNVSGISRCSSYLPDWAVGRKDTMDKCPKSSFSIQSGFLRQKKEYVYMSMAVLELFLEISCSEARRKQWRQLNNAEEYACFLEEEREWLEEAKQTWNSNARFYQFVKFNYLHLCYLWREMESRLIFTRYAIKIIY